MSFPEELVDRLEDNGVVACLTIEKVEHAVPLAKALAAGGIDVLELMLRTDASLEALKAICSEVPEMVKGVGTILTPTQAVQVKDAGADFGVSPGLNVNVVKKANEIGLPFAPGVCTPSDIETAVELGCKLLKFFPAEPSGGVKFLKSVLACLNLRFPGAAILPIISPNVTIDFIIMLSSVLLFLSSPGLYPGLWNFGLTALLN